MSPQVASSVAARAETLLQTINGIVSVGVDAHPAGGIAVVRVHPDAGVSRGLVVRNIRSALYAGLGIAVSQECIEFHDDASTVAPAGAAAVLQSHANEEQGDAAQRVATIDVTPIHAAASLNVSAPAGMPAAPRPGSASAGINVARVASTAVENAAKEMVRTARAYRELSAPAEEEVTEPVITAENQVVGSTVRNIVASAAPLRLESVEMRRQAGRLRCRVVVSLGNDHFGAVADSSDPAVGEIHLAGRVACDALRAGGFTGARFDGATLAAINGRHHVVVALSEWMSGETIVLSGAAPLEELPERAAAIAAIKAVLAQDIS